MKTRSESASNRPGGVWQAVMSDRYPVHKSKAYVCKPRFRAACVDGFRVISRRVSNGKYLTFCPLKVSHLLDESEDVGTFVCNAELPVRQTMDPVSSDACPICLDDVVLPTSAFVTRCGHMYHRTCVLNAWKHELHNCAMCRSPIERSYGVRWSLRSIERLTPTPAHRRTAHPGPRVSRT